MASESFKIIYTGNISPSADRQQVIAKFAKLFRIDSEKAGNILNRDKPVTLLKKVAHEKAYSIKSTLTELGIAVEMERVTSLAHDSSLGLTPIDPNFSPQGEADKPTSFITCPACKTEQEQSDICISCGVVFEKYKQQQQTNIRNNATETARYTQISDESRTRNVDTAEMPAFKDDRLPDIRRVMGYIVFGGVLIFSALYFL